MEKLQYRSDNYSIKVRIALVLITIVSFPFNLIGTLTETAWAGSINQIVAVSTAISKYSSL
jgi:hypothetical protein